MQQVSALTSGWSEREIRDVPPTKTAITGWSDQQRSGAARRGGGSTGRERKRKRERIEDHTHMRDPACTWLEASDCIRRLFPSRDCPPFVSRCHPADELRGLTRTELCHRAALCYEAVIQRARENMRRAETYVSTTVHAYCGGWSIRKTEPKVEPIVDIFMRTLLEM